jgi:1-deoxy-D-xylulose-5-phosphate reductoisomerase
LTCPIPEGPVAPCLDSPEKTAVVVLGSTGSVGTQTLDVISLNPHGFRVLALAGGRNSLALLTEQAYRFKPEYVVLPKDTSTELPPGTKALCGEEGLRQVATLPQADVVVAATSGIVGLEAVYWALEEGKRVALANKETLVAAGPIIMEQARKHKGEIIPIDSEHSALFQCLQGKREEVKRLILSASGGPFRERPVAELQDATPEEALSHPLWSMGKKISIDSATLMNKGLEVIEARWLFNIEPERISVVIHPQGVIHSLVEYLDGAMLAQMGPADMRIPISYALGYPCRINSGAAPLNLTSLSGLTFEEPDTNRFPLLRLAYEALREDDSATVVLNAANEEAVHAFLNGRIGFCDIPVWVEKALSSIAHRAVNTLEEVREIDRLTRELVLSLG